MTQCTVIPTVAPSRGQRLLETVARWLGRSAASREAIDQAWIDTGFGRLSDSLSRATLEDIGAPPADIDEAERRAAWHLASSLDATRLM